MYKGMLRRACVPAIHKARRCEHSTKPFCISACAGSKRRRGARGEQDVGGTSMRDTQADDVLTRSIESTKNFTSASASMCAGHGFGAETPKEDAGAPSRRVPGARWAQMEPRLVQRWGP